jgi:acid phosphatase type 7
MFSIMNNTFLALFLVAAFGISCSPENPREKSASAENHVALELKVPPAFRFVAFGDTRFHDPSDTEAANAAVRRALVAAIDKENPAFISIGGDVVYVGENPQDWQVWDSETAIWREHKIPVYPAIGNHDLKGHLHTALSNYFARFPELQESRFYSVRLGNSLMLVLDSALDEVSGPQSDWLRSQLDHLSSSTDFVFLVFHHPPYTSSSDDKAFGGGHSARATEQALAKVLEDRQQHMRARIVVFNGHVHNYERHEHGGVTYFVSGGGGAHAYPIDRAPDDPYQSKEINYHYLLVEVDHQQLKITMNRVDLTSGEPAWTQPDSVKIAVPMAMAAKATGR